MGPYLLLWYRNLNKIWEKYIVSLFVTENTVVLLMKCSLTKLYKYVKVGGLPLICLYGPMLMSLQVIEKILFIGPLKLEVKNKHVSLYHVAMRR